MRRLLSFVVVLAASGLGLFVPSAAAPDIVRSLTVSGTEVGMYPAFDPAVLRYAATTTASTGGTLEITATTSDPSGSVLVDGQPATTPTTVSGLAEGQEVSVVIDDTDGRTTYSVMYLPAGFPALYATTRTPDREQPGLIGLTLNAFDGAQPAFGAIVDRNGVPVYAVDGPWDTDLKQQPNGDVTVSRLTRAGGGHTGYALVTLDRSDRSLPEEPTSYEVTDGLTDTDGHDSIRLADGSTATVSSMVHCPSQSRSTTYAFHSTRLTAASRRGTEPPTMRAIPSAAARSEPTRTTFCRSIPGSTCWTSATTASEGTARGTPGPNPRKSVRSASLGTHTMS